ncbi:unnamed protein product [Orchesella dallaii]|uniref:Oocyst wall protein n=1 Tax=Orchesella dallaii TaxID=48710 RepID=A0ABP1PSH0_9HEXA
MNYKKTKGLGGNLYQALAKSLRTGPNHSVYARGHVSCSVPSWIAFNKQVLVFEAYCQEPIPEAAMESYQIPKCKKNDTAQVIEPMLPENFCPDNSNKETILNECPPQEPITVIVPACKVTYTDGNAHTCAPGALKCNMGQDEQQSTIYGNACII